MLHPRRAPRRVRLSPAAPAQLRARRFRWSSHIQLHRATFGRCYVIFRPIHATTHERTPRGGRVDGGHPMGEGRRSMTGLPSDLMRCCRWDAPRSMIRRVPLRASQWTRGTTPRQVSSARPPRRRRRSPRSSSMPLSPPGHDLGNASTKTEGGPGTKAAPLWPPAPCRAPPINHTTRRQRRCRSPCGSGRHLPAGAQPCYIRLDFRCRVTSSTSKTGHPAGGRGITLRRSVPRRLLVSSGRSVGETTVVMARR